MAKVWRVLGHYNAETQAYSALAGTFGSSPYNPDFNGRLVGIRLLEGQEAATSLMCDVQVRMTCTTFNPNSMDFAINGGGLKTVPVAYQADITYAVDQQVRAGVPITIEARNATATGVTVSVIVLGCFEVQ